MKKYLDSDSMELARAKEEAYALFTCASELRIVFHTIGCETNLAASSS